MTTLRWVAVLAVVLAVGGCAGPDPERRQAILILLDAARPDGFSAYGYARETTPNIDALARDGLVFTSFFAQGTHTREALPALFHSRYFMPPIFLEIGAVPYAAPDELFQRADPEATSLPRALSAAGFWTAGLSAHSWIAEQSALAREFDEFQDLSTRLRYPKREFFPPAAQVVDAAVDWLARHRDRDVFLYLHLMDTHTPHYFDADAQRWFSVPGFRADAFDVQGRPLDTTAQLEGANRAYLDALYDGDLHGVDRELGRLIESLRRAGVLDRMLIAITADHGEALLEHPGRFGHGSHWFDDVGRIPFIVYYPRRVRPGRVDGFAEQVDIAPTLLGLLGVSVPDGKRMDGIDLLHDGGTTKTRAVMARGIRTGRYKALFQSPADVLAGDASVPTDVELYDLEEDPGEMTDVHAARSAVVAELAAEYRAALRTRHTRFERARAKDAPPRAFAIASAHFTTRPSVPRVETHYGRMALASLPAGRWIEAARGAKSALVARRGAPSLEVELPVPNGTYAVSFGMRGACRLEVAGGAGGELVSSPIDLEAKPGALWHAEPAAVGTVTVTGERFRATVTPSTDDFVLRWIGFDRPGAATADDSMQRERTERLRGLGYVE